MIKNDNNKCVEKNDCHRLEAITAVTHDKMSDGGILTTRIHCFQSNKPILPTQEKESNESNN